MGMNAARASLLSRNASYRPFGSVSTLYARRDSWMLSWRVNSIWLYHDDKGHSTLNHYVALQGLMCFGCGLLSGWWRNEGDASLARFIVGCNEPTNGCGSINHGRNKYCTTRSWVYTPCSAPSNNQEEEGNAESLIRLYNIQNAVSVPNIFFDWSEKICCWGL